MFFNIGPLMKNIKGSAETFFPILYVLWKDRDCGLLVIDLDSYNGVWAGGPS